MLEIAKILKLMVRSVLYCIYIDVLLSYTSFKCFVVFELVWKYATNTWVLGISLEKVLMRLRNFLLRCERKLGYTTDYLKFLLGCIYCTSRFAKINEIHTKRVCFPSRRSRECGGVRDSL